MPEPRKPAELEAPLDAGDAASVKAHAKAAKTRDEMKREFLVAAMERVDGRMFFYDLLTTCHCFTNPYSSTDRGTAFNCGEMNIGLPLLAELNTYCTEQYLTMMKENQL